MTCRCGKPSCGGPPSCGCHQPPPRPRPLLPPGMPVRRLPLEDIAAQAAALAAPPHRPLLPPAMPVRTVPLAEIQAAAAASVAARAAAEDAAASAASAAGNIFAGSRADFVVATAYGLFADLPDGASGAVDGLLYARRSGSTVIPDLPGWVPGSQVHVGHFGAVADVAEPATSATMAGATNNHAAIQAANDAAERLGSALLFGAGSYATTGGLRQTVSWAGTGVDRWEAPSAGPSSALGARGTSLYVTGLPSETITIAGVTGMTVAGGTRTNPEPTANHSDDEYRLLDFTARDAAGATPATLRPLKCGIIAQDNTSALSIDAMRVVLDAAGISGYTNPDYSGLGADYDIGILALNTPHYTVGEHAQVVGYWRDVGVAFVAASLDGDPIDGTTVFGSMRGYAQGYRGVAVRGLDVLRCLAVTSTTIELPWSPSNPVRPSGRVVLGATSVTYDAVTRSGDRLVLSGLSTDPTGLVAVGGEVGLGTSWGATGIHIGGIVTDLQHVSRLRACHATLGFPAPSAGLEISGANTRGITVSAHLFAQDVLFHFHDVGQVFFVSSYFEPNGWKTGGSWGPLGARCIASYGDDGAYPCGKTDYLSLDTAVVWHYAADLSPFIARNGSAVRYSGAGLFRPLAARIDCVGPAGTPGPRGVDSLKSGTRLRLGGPEISTGPRLEVVGQSDFTRHFQVVAGAARVGPATDTLAVTLEGQSDGYAEVRARTTGAGQNAGVSWQTISHIWRVRAIESTGNLAIEKNGALHWTIGATGNLLPGVTATRYIGSSEFVLAGGFTQTAFVTTSDAREKNWLGEITAAERRALRALLSRIGRYQFLDAVAAKGAGARIHYGLTVQDVIAAYEAEGLDPWRYAPICRDPLIVTVPVTREVIRPVTREVTREVERVEIRDGIPVLITVSETATETVTDQVQLIREDGSPVLDDLGAPVMISVPRTESSTETIIENTVSATDYRLGLRYEELTIALLWALAGE